MHRIALLLIATLGLAGCPKEEPPVPPAPPTSKATASAPPVSAPVSVATEGPAPAARALVAWSGTKGSDWDAVKALQDEQKHEAAAAKVAEILKAARAAQNSEEVVRAITRTVSLRIALHGYEKAVRFLEETPWPEDLLADATLRLFYANAVLTYTRSYSYEVRQREQVVSKGPVDLKQYTWEQLHQFAHRQFHAIWQQRAALGDQSVKLLDEYLNINTYPRSIRATIRDAATYLWVEQLADSSGWRPEQQSGLHALDLDALLADDLAVPALLDPSVHPLRKLSGLLADLERWHTGRGAKEAAFEARRRRAQFLHNALSDTADRARIRGFLQAGLDAVKGQPWWSMGMATLAELVDSTGDRVEARRLAVSGRDAHPASMGGLRCVNIIARIDSPAFSLESMAQDAPDRRSVGVQHKNLERLYFRAYRFNLAQVATDGDDYNLLPSGRAVRDWIDTRNPIAEWTVDLPATPDFKQHRTWITPPIKGKGSYVIAATPDAGFDRDAAPMRVVYLTLSDLVVLQHTEGGSVHVQAVSGATGAPIPGATIQLYRNNWRTGHTLVKTARTDAQGEARLRGSRHQSHFIIASKGQDVTLSSNQVYLRSDDAPRVRNEVLAYTDRSVYRPGQVLHWQVVAWSGTPEDAQLKTSPGRRLEVQLRDSNNEVVVKASVKTNGFGSAAGQFTIPTGRALGRWRLTTSRNTRGGRVRVEEYKRPTFEASLKAPTDQMRLNQPATLSGEARYYFGLPVTAGSVKWQVKRSPVYPWWWVYYWRGPSVASGAEVVGTGTSALDDSGRFTINFTPTADERLATGKGRSVTYNYAISAEITDEGGETRSASRTIRLGFVTVQANIQAEQAFYDAGKPVPLTITRTTLDGEPATGKGAWRLMALKNPAKTLAPADLPVPVEEGAVTTPGDRLRPRWNPSYDVRRVLTGFDDGAQVAAGDVQHDAKGEAEVVLKDLKPGAYRLRYTTTDAFGAAYENEQIVVVAGETLPVSAAVDFRVQRSSVKVGGTVRALVHSGLAGQPLIFERWRNGKRIERRMIIAGRDAPIIEIPVTEADRGGMGLSLQMVHDHQTVRLSRSITVPWDDRELSVAFETFRDTLRPGQAETWTVKITAPDAQQRATEVLAYMYDKSLDIFAPHSPPNPRSLLPWRGAIGSVNTTLGMGRRVGVRSGRFPDLPGYPPLEEDRLLMISGFGIGGLGLRNGRGGGGYGSGGRSFRARTAAPAPGVRAKRKAFARELRADKAEAADEAAPAVPDEKAAANPPGDAMRSNFSETAFFQPQLVTGPDGSVAIRFEVPDSVTAWNVWVHAIRSDLSYGSLKKEVRTVKDLMVRPYLPRFLREADKAQIEVVVNNAGKTPLSGQLVFDIIDPQTEKSVADQFGLTAAQRTAPFSADPSKSARQRFAITAPSTLMPVAFKVTATAGNLSDGELRPLPVLPGRVHLAQSRFTTLKGVVKKTLRFDELAQDDDATRINEQLVVTLDAQLFYGVLGALPYLINYPYECAEQTLNRFVSTGILSSLFDQYPAVAKMARQLSARDTALERWDAPDPNRKLTLEETPWLQAARGGPEDFEKVLDPRIANAQRRASLAKLRKMQTSAGAFPWWSGGRPSPYMTLYMLHGFSKALEFKVDVPKGMVQRAWGYMKRHYLDRHLKEYIAKDCCWQFITTINYVVSNYPDASWTGGAITAADQKTMLDFSFKHWKQHSPLLKGYLALTLHRAGRTADAKLVWQSVLDSAKEAPDEGTFWAPEDRSWLWYNDRIETHAFALKVTMEIEPKWPKLDGMVLWLFINKKLNHWKSTRATAEVIYSLAHYLKKTGQLGIREETQVRIGARDKTFVFEPDTFSGKKNQIVVKGPDLKPKQDATIVIDKKTEGFQLASATWHFSTEKMPAEAHGDFLKVTRTYYRRDKSGRNTTLTPLKEGTPVQVGDEIEVQLSLTSKHALEYVHLRDPRGAGYEPVSLRSQHKYDLGIRWFEEVRDSATNFFFEALPKGEYTFKYRLRATTAGTFKVGPATVQPMYAPEFTAYSAGHVLGIQSAR